MRPEIPFPVPTGSVARQNRRSNRAMHSPPAELSESEAAPYAPEPLQTLRPWKVLPKHIRKRLRGRVVMAVATGENDEGVRVATVTHRAGDGQPETETFTLERGR